LNPWNRGMPLTNPTEARGGALNSHTVFIVDPECCSLYGLDAMLQRHDLRVRTFSSAEHFFAALRPSDSGVVVACTELPGIDGLMLLQRLTRIDRELPVILLSSNANVSLAVRALRAGAFDFLEKPTNPRRLLHRIKQALALAC